MSAAPVGRPVDQRSWNALPELPLPAIRLPTEHGRMYTVAVVGVTMGPPGPRGRQGLPWVQAADPATPADLRYYRLPDTLGAWAHDTAAGALAGVLHFPCDIEFGRLNGNAYAEFIA